jgi:hypothetical protein
MQINKDCIIEFLSARTILAVINITNSFSLSFLHLKKAKYIHVREVEILLALIWVDGRGTITFKSRTIVVLQLVSNVALIDYTYHFLYILTDQLSSGRFFL